MKFICDIIFSVFVFCFVFFSQADIIAVAQHILSGGQTHYNHVVGAILITIFLFAMQRLVYRLTKFTNKIYSLTYIPSFLLLMLMTDIAGNVAISSTCWHLCFTIPLALAAAYIVYKAAYNIPKYKNRLQTIAILSRELWLNILQLLVMMLLTLWACNTNRDDHAAVSSHLRKINADIELARQQRIKAEQDSLREIFVHDSILAAKDSIRKERLRIDSLERLRH